MSGILGNRAWRQSNGGLWLPRVHEAVRMGFCCCPPGPPGGDCEWADYPILSFTIVVPAISGYDGCGWNFYASGTWVTTWSSSLCNRIAWTDPPYNNWSVTVTMQEGFVLVTVNCYGYIVSYRKAVAASGDYYAFSELSGESIPLYWGTCPGSTLPAAVTLTANVA